MPTKFPTDTLRCLLQPRPAPKKLALPRHVEHLAVQADRERRHGLEPRYSSRAAGSAS